jgi:radical SAM superfamily enzyme YgiQ (UPF0313 family)
MQGECDYAIIALAEMLEGKRFSKDVPGLVYRENGEIRLNPRDVVDDVDVLPIARRSFLDRYYQKSMYGYLTVNSGLDMMITSRGCPYRCSFCFKVEKRYRFRSSESVLAEMDMLQSRGVRHLHIMDDAFTVNKKRCHEIADEMIRRKYGFKLKIRSRVNSIDLEILKKLKRAGVKEIVYGLESGSQAILDSMDKHTTVELNERAVQLTNKAGIFCVGDIMIGMPGETPDTINETIAFLKRNMVIVGNVPYLYPLPGTKVYDDAKANGTLRGEWGTDDCVPWIKLPWIKSIGDLEVAKKRVERAVHRNPVKALYFIWHNPQFLSPGNIKKRIRQLYRMIR